jgi:excisionase family DNA binding protein
MAATRVEPKAQVLEREPAPDQEPVSASPSEQALLDKLEDVLREASEEATAQRRPILVGADGEEVELPEPIFHLLRQIVPHLRRGHAVSLVPVQQELTTQQAADLLNVSRPFLVGLLERGEIPYVKTGTHRRIRYGDLLRFKRLRDATRRQALDRLTELSQEMGLDAYQD